MHGGRPQRSTNHTGYVSPWTPKAYTKGLQAISLANLSDNTFTGGMLAVFFWTLFSPYPRSMRSQKLTHKSFSIISVKTSLLTLWLGHSKKESLSNHGWLPQSHGLTVGVAFVFSCPSKTSGRSHWTHPACKHPCHPSESWATILGAKDLPIKAATRATFWLHGGVSLVPTALEPFIDAFFFFT